MKLENLSSNLFGKLIKETREKINLSQRETAKRSGMSVNLLFRLEKGEESPPGDDRAIRIANTLGLNAEKTFLLALVLRTKPAYRKYLPNLPKYLADFCRD